MDDLALTQALAAGDEAAFHELVGQQSTRIFRICYRILGHVDDAKDATQETFVLAYRALPTFRGEGTAAAWLARIASRECWRRAAATARRGAAVTPLDEVLSATLTAATDLAREAIEEEERRSVRQAVAALPDPYREVVTLRFFGDLSISEIAGATGRPESTIKTQLRRGMARLREALGGVPS